ncbi:MAG: hypothetical protein QG657_1751 [Acidobacteriota bacterium]|nr:hypothetical protein [Acidobacteriota bacterium]
MSKKLKLSEIKIQSFVTSLEDDAQQKVKGGATHYLTKCNTCDTCDGLC